MRSFKRMTFSEKDNLLFVSDRFRDLASIRLSPFMIEFPHRPLADRMHFPDGKLLIVSLNGTNPMAIVSLHSPKVHSFAATAPVVFKKSGIHGAFFRLHVFKHALI